MIRRALQTFLGRITSLDPRELRDEYCQDSRNVLSEDGRLKPRRGYRVLSEPASGITDAYGLSHLIGYSTDSASELEEFLSFEKDDLSGAVHPFVYDPDPSGDDCNDNSRDNDDPWNRYVITTPGGQQPELDASDWVAVPFDQHAYAINPNETASVKRYTMECLDSWLDIDAPPTPTEDLVWVQHYGNTQNPYQRLSFTGVHTTNDIAFTGKATSATITSDGDIEVTHSDPGSNGASSVTITLDGATGPGKTNWYDNDLFLWFLQIPAGSGLDQVQDVQITFINDDGEEFAPEIEDTVLPIGGYDWSSVYRLHFMDKVRSQWGSLDNSASGAKIQKLKMAYRITGFGGSNLKVIIRRPWTGGVWLEPPPTNGREPRLLRLGYSWFQENGGLDSDIKFVEIPHSATTGYAPLGDGFGVKPIGAQIRVTFPERDAGATHHRLWVHDFAPLENVDVWRRVVQLPNEDIRGLGDNQFDYEITWREVRELPERGDNPEGKFKKDNCTNAFKFRGSMCWLYAEGKQNVRYSWVGAPLEQASTTDDPEELSRGATFTLSPQFDDQPLWGADVGEGVIIVGSYGVYSQVGRLPSELTPPQKLPGSFGCANKFCAVRWKHGETDGVAALARDGQGLYFYRVDRSFGDSPPRAVEISAGIRGAIKDFLVDTQTGVAGFSTARMAVDPASDSLWIVNGSRAIVLRKESLLDGARQWEFYDYNLGDPDTTIKYITSSPRWRLKWMRSDASLDEPDWNTTDDEAIEGSNRDGGNPVEDIYWHSKVFSGKRRRVFRIWVDKATSTDSLKIEVTTGSTVREYQVQSTAKWVKIHPDQRDENISYRIILEESSGEIYGIIAEESDGAGKGVQYA